MSGWDQRACAAQTSGVATPARGGRDQPSRSPHGAQPNDRWGGPSPYQGGVAPGPELPAMAIADAIFDEIRASGTETRAPELTDRHLEVLAAVFRENHLANALELVQTGRVKRLVAERSGRSCFQVQGKSAEKSTWCIRGTTAAAARSSGTSSAEATSSSASINSPQGSRKPPAHTQSRPSPISSWRNS